MLGKLKELQISKLPMKFDAAELAKDYLGLLNSRHFDSESEANAQLYAQYKHLQPFYSNGNESFYEHISLTTYNDPKICSRNYIRNEQNMTTIFSDVPSYTLSVLKKFSPFFHRCRYSTILPGGYVKPHRDYTLQYSVRIHVPIITNLKAVVGFGENGDVGTHLAADGSVWFLNQSVVHWAKNLGTSSRTHLIICVKPEFFETIL